VPISIASLAELCQNPGSIGAAFALQLPDFHNPALLCQKLIFLA